MCIRDRLYYGKYLPVAELGDQTNIVSVFVYGSRIGVPDYMVKTGHVYRLVTDHIGSVRLVVDISNGTIAQRLKYDEFGVVLEDTNPGFQPFGFAGGLYDSDTGLLHMGRRVYDPSIKKWLSSDPILFQGGQFNLYAYVASDPINRTDITGTGPWDKVKDATGKLISSQNPFGWYTDLVDLGKKAQELREMRQRMIDDPFSVGYSGNLDPVVLQGMKETARYIANNATTFVLNPSPIPTDNPYSKENLPGTIVSTAISIENSYEMDAIEERIKKQNGQRKAILIQMGK